MAHLLREMRSQYYSWTIHVEEHKRTFLAMLKNSLVCEVGLATGDSNKRQGGPHQPCQDECNPLENNFQA